MTRMTCKTRMIHVIGTTCCFLFPARVFRHPCKCNFCLLRKKKGLSRFSQKLQCKWRKRHSRVMRTMQFYNKPLVDYFVKMPMANPIISSPRERHVLHLLCTLHPMMIESLCALDISQSYHMCAFRQDGIIPCVATQSKIFVPCWGRHLQIAELYFLMGFPEGRFNFQLWPKHALQHALGNTMHVAVVGAVTIAMLVSLSA